MGWLPDGDDDDLSFETTPRGPPPGPLKPLPPRSTKRRAVVVDSDLTNFAGDFWGLAYLLSSKDCDVVYVMASGGDTRMKMRILSKFLAHCGREDVEVGAGPPGAEPGWLKPDARGSYRPAAEWSEGCVPHPVLRDWAKHYDDSRHLARGQFYDPVVRLRDRLDAAAAAGAPATVVCLGSAETLRRLLDLDADALSRDGRDVRVCCRFGSLDGSRARPARPEAARRVFAAVGDVVVLPVDACAAEDHTPTGQTSLAKLPPFLCGDSQISLALAQVQLALTHVCRADPCRDFLAGALAAFLGAPPDEDALELLVRRSDPATRWDVDGAGRLAPSDGGFAVRVVTGWADDVAAETLRDLLVGLVANAARVRAAKDRAPPSRREKPPRAATAPPSRRPSTSSRRPSTSSSVSMAWTSRSAAATTTTSRRPSTATLRRWQPGFLGESDPIPSFM